MKCECGGSFRPLRLKQTDFSGYSGLPGVVVANLPGLRCARCGEELLPGDSVQLGLAYVVMAAIERETILSAPLARFLRRYIGVTQDELAGRMEVSRVTIADWERGEQPLSPANDHTLR